MCETNLKYSKHFASPLFGVWEMKMFLTFLNKSDTHDLELNETTETRFSMLKLYLYLRELKRIIFAIYTLVYNCLAIRQMCF